jgi:hypothetical protein
VCVWGGVEIANRCTPPPYLGSFLLASPRPYIGMTLSRSMPALHTGQSLLCACISNHCAKHGQLREARAGRIGFRLTDRRHSLRHTSADGHTFKAQFPPYECRCPCMGDTKPTIHTSTNGHTS